MYDLFSRVPMTLDELRRSMCEFVKDTGKALVTDQASDPERARHVGTLLCVLCPPHHRSAAASLSRASNTGSNIGVFAVSTPPP